MKKTFLVIVLLAAAFLSGMVSVKGEKQPPKPSENCDAVMLQMLNLAIVNNINIARQLEAGNVQGGEVKLGK